ncbi:cell division protein ZapA [Aquimarina sp. RZ0]|uniref:cell division protein ZapA n=1 Tax=Aquimarina sp. RZ0 TaxID=2607730 RepID=UPI0011F120A6|nr:cell division protein ZapA [Aquimarina sp. RZ0]KAA1245490.1 cell division protein ZapA [Aquimarina sp. RZ0]
MADKLKIKISVADRVYPLTINPDQEEGLRKAAKKIEAMIKQFEQSYAVRDKQDVLAMCALQFAAQVEQKVIDKDSDDVNVSERLNALNTLLHDHLS